MNLGEKIQTLRKAQGMSQEALAQQLEVSRQSVSKWELNDSVPDVSKIIMMSNLFSVTTDYLLKDSLVENNESNDNHIFAKVLYIASTFLIGIGLLLVVDGILESQTYEAVIIGFIVHAVGIAALLIGRVICPSEHISLKLSIANLALLSFMPVSLISNIIIGGIYPIPATIFASLVIVFVVLYSIVLVVGIIVIKKRSIAKV